MQEDSPPSSPIAACYMPKQDQPQSPAVASLARLHPQWHVPQVLMPMAEATALLPPAQRCCMHDVSVAVVRES